MLANHPRLGKLDRAVSKRAALGRAFAGQLLLLSIMIDVPHDASSAVLDIGESRSLEQIGATR